MKKKKSQFPAGNPQEIIESVASTAYFTGVDEVPPALTLNYVPGTGPVALVLGPNASGKSLFRRLARAVCGAEVEFMGVSMEFRSSEGIGRAFVYGSENWESTGRNSASSVIGGLRTCRARTEPHVLFLDEPDVGLSDGYARGVGKALADFARNPAPHTRALFVVSHRKALVQELAGVNPHVVFMGDAGAPTLTDWLTAVEPARPLEDLMEQARATFLRVTAIRRALGLS